LDLIRILDEYIKYIIRQVNHLNSNKNTTFA